MELILKNLKGAMPVILLLALALSAVGVTGALSNYTQFRNNEIEEYQLGYKVNLVESTPDLAGWKFGDAPLRKEIIVENKGVAADGLGPAYIRFQLKEYMEIGTVRYSETKERYMVGKDGKFIVFNTAAQARNAWPGHEISGRMTDVVTGATGYFVQSGDGDPNGQFGKYVVTEFSSSMDNAVPVIPGSARVPDKDKGEHFDPVKGECAYPLHKWETASRLATRDYVKWVLDDNAVALSDWLASPETGAFWVYDNVYGTGWVYWMQLLEPEASTAKFEVLTEMVKLPSGTSGEAAPFYYVIHTDMQSISPDGLDEDAWEDMPAQIGATLSAGGSRLLLNPQSAQNPQDAQTVGFLPASHETDIDMDFRGYLTGWVDYNGKDGEIGFSDQFGDFNKNYWQLENIIAGFTTGYPGMTVEADDPKFAGSFSIGPDKNGKPSVISSYIPAPAEYAAWFERHGTDSHPNDITAKITLTQGGRSADFTVTHLYDGVLTVMNKPLT